MKSILLLNKKLRRPEWEILKGNDEVFGVRYSQNELCFARAEASFNWITCDQVGTVLYIKFVYKGRMRVFCKRVKKPLQKISRRSLVRYWSQMLSSAMCEIL